ncbi:MAG: hypothetical protein HQK51_05020 [Oligoflexia bacterium]|nr:hypothetical protein [Oligoflexia bacterium]
MTLKKLKQHESLASNQISIKSIKFLFYLTILFLFIGCSMAPLTSTKNASTLGASNWEISTGFVPTPSLSASRGFGKDFDSGIIIEGQMFPLIALWGKYAFRNFEGLEFFRKDYAFSLYGGIFHALDPAASKGFFIGPVISYKYNWTEVFLSVRYNWTHWDSVDASFSDKENFIFHDLKREKETLSYMQYSLGVNFWFTEKFGLSLAGKVLQAVDGSNYLDFTVLPSAELMFKF